MGAMTDTTNGYLGADNAQAADREPVDPSMFTDLDATIDTDALARALATETPERVATYLSQWRGYLNHYAETAKRLDRQRDYAVMEQRSLESLRQRDQRELEHALESIHNGTTPFALDMVTVWQPWLEAIVVAGIRAGYASEVHRLMNDLSAFGSLPRDVWETTSASLRQADGAYPETVSPARAVVLAEHHYRLGAAPRIHPADPRLAEGWREIWHTAKRGGLCDVWDTMAELMGIPKVAPLTREGYVQVSGSFTVSVRVSGVEDGDQVDIGFNDIVDAIAEDPAYALDIDEIDDSELEFE